MYKKKCFICRTCDITVRERGVLPYAGVAYYCTRVSRITVLVCRVLPYATKESQKQ